MEQSDEKKTDDTTAAELRELEAKITAARERSAAVDAKRVLKAKRLEAEDAIHAAEDAEKLEELEAEHGPVGRMIAGFRTTLGLIVVKRAAGVAWHRFMSSKMKAKDEEDLIRACLVFPTREKFNEIVEELPGVLPLLANKIGVLYGLKKEEDEGK